jgi:hypothetical protein
LPGAVEEGEGGAGGEFTSLMARRFVVLQRVKRVPSMVVPGRDVVTLMLESDSS